MILACPSFFDHQPFAVANPSLSTDEAPHALLAALRRIVPTAKALTNVLSELATAGWTIERGPLPANITWLPVPWDAFRLSGFNAMQLTAVDYPLTGMTVIATTRPNLFARELVDSKFRLPKGLLIMINDDGLAVFPDDRPWDDSGHTKALGVFQLDPRQFSSADEAQAAVSDLADVGYLIDLTTTPVLLD